MHVDDLVVGRIRKTNAAIVLYAELVGANGLVLWSRRFSRPPNDVMSLEEEFASSLAASLGIELSGEQEARLSKKHTASADAYRLYQTGRYFLNKREKISVRKAIDYFEQAADIDPEYALAYAGLADAYALLNVGYYQPEGDIPIYVALSRAAEAAERALELDPGLPDAHASLGLVSVMNRRHGDAEKHYREAIRLSPSHVTARQWYSRLLSFQGRHEEATTHARAATELDPVSPLQHRTLGFAYYDAREYRLAAESFTKTLELDERYPFARHTLALCYWYTGQKSLAIEHFRRTKPWLGQFFESASHAQIKDALAVLRFEENHEPPWLVPLYYAIAGEYDLALEYLARAQSSTGDENLAWTLREKAFDPILEEVRFKAIVRRAGLKWRWGMEEGAGSK